MKNFKFFKFLILVVGLLVQSAFYAGAQTKSNAKKPLIVFVTGDHEYSGEITMPILAAEL